MRLLNTHTRKLEEFLGAQIPSYAILSHTWEDVEVTFKDITNPPLLSKPGWQKIARTCDLTASLGLDYVWIDTCCINKSSSEELSEAINSMFAWYKGSTICIAYLYDLEPESVIPNDLKYCRWFTRGWTLQELIASPRIDFHDAAWVKRGTKQELSKALCQITGIDEEVLRDSSLLTERRVATKMAWAASRQTTRIEDSAYSLLGIFDVNMPLLYGEGTKAFTRLQEEILRTTDDLTLFGWESREPDQSRYRGMFARDAAEFGGVAEKYGIQFPDHLKPTQLGEMSVTSRGLRIITRLLHRCDSTGSGTYIMPLGSGHYNYYSVCRQLGVYLTMIGPDLYVRTSPSSLCVLDQDFCYERSRRKIINIPRYLKHPFDESVKKARRRAIQIKLEPYLEIGQAVPEWLWDPQASRYLIPETSSTWWAFYIRRISPTRRLVRQQYDFLPPEELQQHSRLDLTVLCFFASGELYAVRGRGDNVNLKKLIHLFESGTNHSSRQLLRYIQDELALMIMRTGDSANEWFQDDAGALDDVVITLEENACEADPRFTICINQPATAAPRSKTI